MRKIILCSDDFGFYDAELAPKEYLYFHHHKDVFRNMWQEQGTPFWTRFVISFRTFTVRNGVLNRLMGNNSKADFEHVLDEAFIFIHDKFVDGKVSHAKSFIDDIAKLAQYQDRLPTMDTKSRRSTNPFYNKETRDVFRRFFGMPDKKITVFKVYFLCPVFVRFAGSVCRCLQRWIEAPDMSPDDSSYWIPPGPSSLAPIDDRILTNMCVPCFDECATIFFREKFCGEDSGSKFLECWTFGDPRFHDSSNPLYNTSALQYSDWRENLTIEVYRKFYQYARMAYLPENEKCQDCIEIMANEENPDAQKSKKKRKRKNKAELIVDNNSVVVKTEILKVISVNDGVEEELVINKNRSRTGLKSIPQSNISKALAMSKPTSSRRHNALFTSQTVTTEDFKYGVMSNNSSVDLKSVVGGFKVIRKEDHKTGALEISITVASLKGKNVVAKAIKTAAHSDSKQTEVQFPLSATLIKEKIEHLPRMFEWYEGVGWCAAVFNYTHEEKAYKKRTNFNIKVTGANEDGMKRTMFKLMFYISMRKKRSCPGWMLDDDDVVTCILPEDQPNVEGVTIFIQRGFRVEQRLTREEKNSQLKDDANISSGARDMMYKIKLSMAQDEDCKEGQANRGYMSLPKEDTEEFKSLLELIGKSPEAVAFMDFETARNWDLLPDHMKAEAKRRGMTQIDPNYKGTCVMFNKNKDANAAVGAPDVPQMTVILRDAAMILELTEIIQERLGEGEVTTSIMDSKNPQDRARKSTLSLPPSSREELDSETIIDGTLQSALMFGKSADIGSSAHSGSGATIAKTATEVANAVNANQTASTFMVSDMNGKGDFPKKACSMVVPNEKTNDTQLENFIENETIAMSNVSIDPANEQTTAQTSNGSDTVVVSKDASTETSTSTTELASSSFEKLDASTNTTSPVHTTDQRAFSVCFNCGTKETVQRQFKKCQRCKEQSVTVARYYCGRECQVADWNNKHKQEHKTGVC